MALEVSGDYLYAAGADSLMVFDISADPAKPRFLSELKGIQGSRQMAIYGDTAYITARNLGLWIVDISDPLHPELVRRYDTIELATGIAATENVLFIAHRVYGVQLLDVSDPANPRHISQVRTSEAQSVAYKDGMLYIGDWAVGKLTIADVRDPRDPKVVAQGTLDGFGDGIFVQGGLCFCSTGHDAKSGSADYRPGNGRGVEAFDVSDPLAPKKLGVFKFPRFLPRNNDFWTSRACGETLFCVDSHNGFFMLDASDSAKLVGRGHLLLPPPVYTWKIPDDRRLANDCCASLATGDGVVYIAGQTTGIHIVRAPTAYKQPKPKLRLEIPPKKCQEPTDPRLWHVDLHSQVHQVAAKGGLVYVAASHGGLKLFQTGQGRAPKEINSWERESVYDVCIQDDILYSAENNKDIAVYKVSGDGNLSETARTQLERDQAVRILHPFLDGKFLAVSSGTGRFSILNSTDPAKLKAVYSNGIGGILYGDMLPERDLGGVFPVNWHSRGIAWYSLRGKAPDMTSKGNPRQGNQLDGIGLLDNGLFVFPLHGSEIALLDPKSPEETKVAKVKGLLPGMPVRGIPAVSRNLVAFASRRDGKVVTIDMSNPLEPVVVPGRCYDLSQGNCGRVAFLGGKMVIPAGHLGLFMEK